MPRSEKDRLAAEVQERWIDLNMALSDKRRYPIAEFKAFWEAGRRYGEMTKRDALMHRVVVEAVNGLTDFLSVDGIFQFAVRLCTPASLREAQYCSTRQTILIKFELCTSGP